MLGQRWGWGVGRGRIKKEKAFIFKEMIKKQGSRNSLINSQRNIKIFFFFQFIIVYWDKKFDLNPKKRWCFFGHGYFVPPITFPDCIYTQSAGFEQKYSQVQKKILSSFYNFVILISFHFDCVNLWSILPDKAVKVWTILKVYLIRFQRYID